MFSPWFVFIPLDTTDEANPGSSFEFTGAHDNTMHSVGKKPTSLAHGNFADMSIRNIYG